MVHLVAAMSIQTQTARLFPQLHYHDAHGDMKASLCVAEEELSAAVMMDGHLTVMTSEGLSAVLEALRAVRRALQCEGNECERCRVSLQR